MKKESSYKDSWKVNDIMASVKLCIENLHYTDEKKISKLELFKTKLKHFLLSTEPEVPGTVTKHLNDIREYVTLISKQNKKAIC